MYGMYELFQELVELEIEDEKLVKIHARMQEISKSEIENAELKLLSSQSSQLDENTVTCANLMQDVVDMIIGDIKLQLDAMRKRNSTDREVKTRGKILDSDLETFEEILNNAIPEAAEGILVQTKEYSEWIRNNLHDEVGVRRRMQLLNHQLDTCSLLVKYKWNKSALLDVPLHEGILYE